MLAVWSDKPTDMKYLYLLLAIALVTSACDKGNEGPDQTSFQGTWILKKSYVDPGNGTGTYIDIKQDGLYITFNSDSTVVSNTTQFGLGMIASYRVLDSVRVRINFKQQSSSPTTVFRYRFKKDTLELNPPCIEGCGMKFVKAKTD
jgi:hypothetical protein